MKFTLKDFQDEAVKALLENIVSARLLYDTQHKPVSMTLAATTGAGKTVMAAAIIESLFFGNEIHAFEPDTRAVILWVTDDPSLNDQTRWRFMEASDKIDIARTEIINDSFDQETFDCCKVYFLNRQKLAVSSNLTKVKDGRSYTLWETINNTIEDEGKHLYMILDEAHKGIGGKEKKRDANERETIYAQLIDGHDGGKPMPIVLGISATIDRFVNAMSLRNRTMLGAVEVDPNDVQDSGLLKDTITLLIPDEAGSFNAALLKEACKALQASDREWARYCTEQDESERVVPLMVIQVPNNVTDDEMFELCEIVQGELPWLNPTTSYANVLGDHADMILGNAKYLVRYAFPQNVQDDKTIRVLFAKEAVSTGWDCPRAEVLFSMRPGQDKTYIMQLVGRMVRTPLARRIDGNDVLNSVACYLPRFNKANTKEVAEYLTGDLEGDGSFSQPKDRKVLTTPVTLIWQDGLVEVRNAFEQLPTMIVPRDAGNQIYRLLDLTGKFALYGIDLEADDEAKSRLIRIIKSDIVRYEDEFKDALHEVYVAHTHTVTTSRVTGEVVEASTEIMADKAIINEGYKATCRLITDELAKAYLRQLRIDKPEADGLDLYAEVAALALMPSLLEDLEASAMDLANDLFIDHRDAIYGLDDEKRGAVEGVVFKTENPQLGEIVIPVSLMVNSMEEIDGETTPIPTYQKHVLAIADSGLAPMVLNDLEQDVIAKELALDDTVAWYRNPSGNSKSALQIPYVMGGRWKSLQPDFVFFSKMADGTIRPSIIDPHGTYLADAMPKLKGLAEYSRQFGDRFKRIEAVDRIEGLMLYLDIKNDDLVKAILATEASDALEIFKEFGRAY